MFHSAFSRSRRFLFLAGLLWAGGLTAQAETLTLAECLRETAAHNPQIIEQHYAIEHAFADRVVFRARALPIFTVGGLVGQLQQESVGQRATKLTAATNTTDSTTFVALGTETLYQPLFDAAIPASFRRGTAAVLAAQENFYAVASAELHLARQQFLTALFQQKNGELLHDIDGALAADVQSQTQLASAGLVGRASLLSAQVQRTNFNPGILATTGAYRTTLATLLQTMGREPSAHGRDALAGITLAGTLGESRPAFDPADATRRALERRPDLRDLRALVRTYNEDVNIAKGGYYPLIRLYVNGEAVPQSNVRSNTPTAVRASDQINTTEIRPGIQEDWNVIDTGTVRGGVRIQEGTRDIVANILAQLERNVPSDLAVVSARLTDAASTDDVLRGSVDTAQNTLNIIRAGVAQGISSQLEFLDAQTTLLSVRSGLLAAELEMSLAHAEFDRITGNYLQFVNDHPPVDKPSHPAKK